MKKLLGISLVAVLAVSPLMARAETTAPVAIANGEGGLAANGTNVIVDTQGKYYAGKSITDADRSATASAAYVKGAYNATISAINAVAATADSAVQEVTTSATEGSISVDGQNVAVTGAVVEGKLDDGANGYEMNLKSLQVQGDTAATLNASQTLTNKTINADNNTISNLETDNLKAGVLVDSTAGIAAATSASDTKLVSEKAVAQAIENLNIANYATETEVTANINASTGSVTLAQGSGLTVAGTPTGTISSQLDNTAFTASVTLPASVDIITDWSTGAVTTLALNNAASATTINGNLTSGVVNSTFTGTGITGGEATGTISNINIAAPTPYVEDQ